MKKIISFACMAIVTVLAPLTATAESLPGFPMSVYGTLTVAGTDAATGATVKAYAGSVGSGNLLDTLIIGESGWYGKNTAFSTKLALNEYSGNLVFTVQPSGGETVTVVTAEITADGGNAVGCSSATAIAFATGEVCRYDIAIVGDATLPTAVTNLVASAVSSSQVNLSWTANTDESFVSYKIYRDTNASVSTSDTLVATITNQATASYSDTVLSAGIIYYYKIYTVNNNGTTASNEVSATTTCATVSNAATYNVAPTCGVATCNSGYALSGGACVIQTCATVSNAATYNAYPTCGAATCNSGYTLSGSSCVAQSSGGGGGSYYTPPSTSTSTDDDTTDTTDTTTTTTATPDGILYRAEGDSKIYVIKDGVKTWIQSAEEFAAAGYDWADVVVTTSAKVNSYPDVSTTTTPTTSTDALYRAEGDTKVYAIKDGKKQWIQSAEEFAAAGYSWSDVVVTTSEKVESYADVSTTTAPTTSTVELYRAEGDTKVYAVKDGKKQWIQSAEEFNTTGYKWSDVVVTTSEKVASYPDGVVAVTKVKVVDTPTLRLRQSNTTSSDILGSVRLDEIFTVLDEKAGWYKIITTEGITGWISGAYATKQ